MMTGVVNDELEATLRVQVVGPHGRSQDVTVVVDTGYNGAITLPLSVISALSLPRGAAREVTLGDASRKTFDYYTAEIVWDGQPRKVRVLCLDGDPLIGTFLLRNYKLNADFVVNGPVVLTAVP